ncbi:hypothetical protein NDU88_006393 [Pleurodeles waltl]|uniref:Uncharacterized protein n=1 Tax=Pleurodeles waltl TaxID=8319 RepID=A0AAV7MJQ7_PLEWA|nr:hypothetical protein NDU88_006393 [Pleurodeles waltl]
MVHEPLFYPFLGFCGEQTPRKVPDGAPGARLKAHFSPGALLEFSHFFLPGFGALGALDEVRHAQITVNTLGLRR